jgi:hypothetical protein
MKIRQEDYTVDNDHHDSVRRFGIVPRHGSGRDKTADRAQIPRSRFPGTVTILAISTARCPVIRPSSEEDETWPGRFIALESRSRARAAAGHWCLRRREAQRDRSHFREPGREPPFAVDSR